jgi:RNA polymerase sigma factor (sigma-70 family)
MIKDWLAVFARVRAALMRRGRSQEDADDLVHEAWIRLACYQREKVVEQPEAFLMRTAINLSIDAYRTRAKHGEEVQLEDVVLVATTPSPEAVLYGRERVARMSVCMNRLNERTRTIFKAHRIHGMSYEDIAREHGLSVSSVEKHIAKATLLITSWMEGW